MTPGFWRGLGFALPLSVLLWLAIFALIYTGWNVG